MKKNIQFKAGYIVDSISETISKNFKPKSIFNLEDFSDNEINKTKGLLLNICCFDVAFNFKYKLNYDSIHPVLATLNNIIVRGLPTKAPVEIENIFFEIGLIKSSSKENEYKFDLPIKEIQFETIFELLHIVKPSLAISKKQYGGSLGSHLEWDFISAHPFLIQILESQRDFATLNSTMVGGKSTDFTFTSPYLHWNNRNKCFEYKTRIFEVDGPHHIQDEYIFYDSTRDISAEENDIETFRFTQETIKEDKVSFHKLIEKNAYSIFEKNYNHNFKEVLTEYSLIFIPIAVARIQKTLIEYFIQNEKIFSKKILKIAIIERDLPCAALAINNLIEYFKNINELLEEDDKLILPKIQLSIFENKEWVIDQRIHGKYLVKDKVYFKEEQFDIILDHAILLRSNIYIDDSFKNDSSIKIRSSHYYDLESPRKLYCSRLLKYKALVDRKGDGSYESILEYEKNINFFISNIFRKVSFREGQLPIISRALQLKPVIGLLPTGGGKSLTFQLPAFLQPGLCLIVDPIKSLMADQVRVLKENWIDCCDFINSSIDQSEKNKRLINFKLGETLMLFVSPERLIMTEFRNLISSVDKSKFSLGFSYCVIDEVHCVSEWGHDFRTTYLMLGKNAQKFCSIKNKEKKVTLIGLTATASFDVLADIERELQIDHEDIANAIIMIENTIRPELFFNIIDVTNKNRIDVLNEEFLSLNKRLAYYNEDNIIAKSQKHHFDEFDQNDFSKKDVYGNYILDDKGDRVFYFNDKYKLKFDLSKSNTDCFSTITFCPVKGTKINTEGEFSNKSGVRNVHKELKTTSKGYFYSSDSDIENEEVNDFFEKFTSDQINHMVCTKAFGMGIDKTDIRSTYHYVYSSSLESFIQECGRAGRDREIALANILIDTNKVYKFDLLSFFKVNKIENTFDRICLRKTLDSYWEGLEKKDVTFKSEQSFYDFIKATDFSFQTKEGKITKPYENSINEIKNIILSTKNTFLDEKYLDRGIHNFFYKKSFKGEEFEITQLKYLFQNKEFADDVPAFGKQVSLLKLLNSSEIGTFKFIIRDKQILFNKDDIKKTLNIHQAIGNYDNWIENALKYSTDVEDFYLKLEEDRVINLEKITNNQKEELFDIFHRNRDEGDTGRLIYRLNTIGFLKDFTFDYNKRFYECEFEKKKSIEDYLIVIDKYLRRYLSENSTKVEIKKLKLTLSLLNIDLGSDLMKCLSFLSVFSYKEIAGKRIRATSDIENYLLEMLRIEGDSFEKNKYLKEQIYFYFNAKYARPSFTIEGNNYSLLTDHSSYLSNEEDAKDILNKYLEVFKKEGTEQNNYKHMMGACKKILQSLSLVDIEKEWVLRLLKAFSMYSINNVSYTSEANKELENGFTNLFNDSDYHSKDYNLIKDIFDQYFSSLTRNLDKTNNSIFEIQLIQNKLLQELQCKGIEDLITTFNNKNNE